MNIVYRVKLIIVFLSGIMWVVSFAALFVGGAAMVNRIMLCANVFLIILQVLNCYKAFVLHQKSAGMILVVCLAITILLMWVTYIWSWNYTVKALTIGFE